jgi:hypothetical protein
VVGVICILVGLAVRTGALNPEAPIATSPKVGFSSVCGAISGVAEPAAIPPSRLVYEIADSNAVHGGSDSRHNKDSDESTVRSDSPMCSGGNRVHERYLLT